MSKLTIRYFIDGAQVDEQALEEDRPETDLRALIEASKHGIDECFSQLDYKPSAGLVQALQAAARGSPHRGLTEGVNLDDLTELLKRPRRSGSSAGGSDSST